MPIQMPSHWNQIWLYSSILCMHLSIPLYDTYPFYRSASSLLYSVQCLPIIPFSFLTELPFYLPILSFNFLSVTPAQHSTVQIPHYDTCSFYQSVSHFDTCPFYCSASSLRYLHILPFSFLTTIPAHSPV